MNAKLCPECGASNPVSEVMCDHCGFPLEGAVAAPVQVAAIDESCPKCGKGVASGMRFCDGCGTNLAEARAQRDAVIADPLPLAPDAAIESVPAPPVPSLPQAVPHLDSAPSPVASVPEPEPEPVPPVADPVVVAAAPPAAPVAASTVAAAPAVGAKARQWKLTCVEGFRLGKEYLLYKQDMLIGRTDAESDIFPELEMTDQDDGFVSRRHARIHCNGDQIAVEDMGGENGTFIDGRPIPAFKQVALGEGSVVRVGKVGLMLKTHASP